MKKMLLLIAMISLIAMSLFSQGSEDSAAPAAPVASATEAGTPGAPIKLRALIGSWNTMAATVEDRKDFYEKQLLAWAERHPDVYVEIEGIPGGTTAQAMTKLITAALAGNPHDFANIDSQWVGNFHEAGVLSPIDAYLDDADKTQFFDFTKMVTMREGRQYGLWAETGLLLYYWNENISPERPAVWEDVFALNDKLKKSGSDTIPFLTIAKGASAAFAFLPFYWAQGTILFDPADNFRPVFGEGRNREAMIRTLNFYRDLLAAGAMPPEIISYEHNEVAAEAKAGNAASFIGGSWLLGQLNVEDWGYGSLPMYKEGVESNIYGGWTFGFLAKDERKLEASVNFVKEVYTDKEAMSERLPLHGYIPVRKDVLSSEGFNTPFYNEIFKQLEVGRARPATSLYPDVEVLVEVAIGKIVAGETDTAKLVDQMFADVSAAYNDR